MDYAENNDGPAFLAFDERFNEMQAQFGSPLFRLVEQQGLHSDSWESSGDAQRTTSVLLGYTYSPTFQSEETVQLRRLVQTMTLERPDDESATVELLIARHLDAAVEENSDGAVDLGFRFGPQGLVLLQG